MLMTSADKTDVDVLFAYRRVSIYRCCLYQGMKIVHVNANMAFIYKG